MTGQPVSGFRVLETSTTVGTGDYSLAGPPGGYQSFGDAFSDGDVVLYAVTDGTNWEEVLGTFTSGSPDTLSRDAIFASSNSGAAVNWGSGTRNLLTHSPSILFDAIANGAKGSSRPAWLKPGGMWLDDTGEGASPETPWILKMWDGTQDATLGSVDRATGDFIPYRAGAAATDAMTNALLDGISTVGQAEAEAGTATTVRLWTAERVQQAIDSRTPPSDAAARDSIAVLAFKIADIEGDAFDLVDGYVDEFGDETDVDTGSSTGETYNAAGDYYSNVDTSLISQGAGTVIGDMTLGGGNSAAFDGTTSQAFGSGARKNSSPAYVGKDWGSGNDRIIGRYKVYGSSDNGFTNVSTFSVELQGSSTGAWAGEEVSLHSDTGITDSSGLTVDYDASDGLTVSTAYRYHRVLVTAASGEIYVAEVEFYNDGTNDMVLLNDAYTADAQPDLARIVIDHEAIDAVTLNTDLTAEVSRDDGTTFTAITLAQVVDTPGDRQILAGEVDISGQPAGTDMVWRLKTFNDKEQRVHGVSLRWDE